MQSQRDEVNHAEATSAFEEGSFSAAARSWGRVTAAPPSFEEVALKFVEMGLPDALQTYLLTKLDTLAPADKAQVPPPKFEIGRFICLASFKSSQPFESIHGRRVIRSVTVEYGSGRHIPLPSVVIELAA